MWSARSPGASARGHPGFGMTPLELIDHTLRASGLPGVAEFPEDGWLDCCPPFGADHFLDGFGHADKKFHFRADWAALGHDHAGLPAFPDHVAVTDDGDPARPFRLVAAPSRSFLNTSFNNTPSGIAREGRPTALIHPGPWPVSALPKATACASAIGRAASSSTPAPLTGCSSGWSWSKGSGPTTPSKRAIGINLLTSADPGLPRGGAVFHDTSVWLRPA